jgi:hypothetical protein
MKIMMNSQIKTKRKKKWEDAVDVIEYSQENY